MSGRSGERARREALGIPTGAAGAVIAQARQTVRYSLSTVGERVEAARRISTALGARKDKGHLIMALQAELRRAKDERQAAKADLSALDHGDQVQVTDHGLVRFLERVMGMDVPTIRAHIGRLIPASVLDEGRAIYIRGGNQFVVVDGSLVTVLGEDMEPTVAAEFAIDGVPVGEFQPPAAEHDIPRNISRAAKLLGRRAAAFGKARRDALHARLRAELGR